MSIYIGSINESVSNLDYLSLVTPGMTLEEFLKDLVDLDGGASNTAKTIKMKVAKFGVTPKELKLYTRKRTDNYGYVSLKQAYQNMKDEEYAASNTIEVGMYANKLVYLVADENYDDELKDNVSVQFAPSNNEPFNLMFLNKA